MDIPSPSTCNRGSARARVHPGSESPWHEGKTFHELEPEKQNPSQSAHRQSENAFAAQKNASPRARALRKIPSVQRREYLASDGDNKDLWPGLRWGRQNRSDSPTTSRHIV